MKKKVVAVLLSTVLCVSMTAQAGAAAFSDGTEDTAAVIETSEATEEFTGGEVSDTTGEDSVSVPDGISEPEPTPTPAAPSVTPEPVITETPSEEPDQDVEVFEPAEPTPTPTPDVSPTPTVDPEEPDIFTSGDTAYGISVVTATEVDKEDWEQADPVNNRYKLRKADGTYYTSADGIVYIKTVEDKSAPSTDTDAHTGYAGYYMFDGEGYMLTGQQMISPGTPGYDLAAEEEFFFMDAVHASPLMGDGAVDVTNCSPLTTDMGQLKLKYWLWTGTAFRYYDSTGKFLTMAELKEIREAAGTYTGYYNINGYYYCMDENGVPRLGDVVIEDGTKPGTYYFQETPGENGIAGAMLRSQWHYRETSKGEQWRYFKSDGRLYERGIVATRLDTEIMGDSKYLLGAAGYIQKNKMLKAANGYYYASDENGRVLTNTMAKFGSARYYFSSDGRRVKWQNCWHRCPGAGNRFYYFGNTAGRVVEKKGWQKVTNTAGKMYGWFYFPSSGDHYTSRWLDGTYYFKENGQLASGLTEINGKTYFFKVSNASTRNGQMFKNTMISYRSKWYYAGPKGILAQNRWVKDNGNYYYFQDDFTMLTNEFVKRGDTYGYVDSSGKFCTGWVVISNAKNQVKYLNPNGKGFLTNTSRVIDGLRYYFDSNGYRRNDLTSIIKGPYYVEVDRVNGVMTIFDQGRTTPVKSIRVSVGLAGTPTPTGTYTLSRSLRWQPLMGPSWGQYGTHVEGAGQGGIFVHSVSGSYANSYSLPAAEYNKLGNPASHGCIRCCVADAKWVYDNCNGATIKIFDGTYKADEVFKGPLGRRALVPLYGSMNFDPTDPAI
ncbi:MAG TPA: L,D-transpeptidase family protein [Candidatus Blautia faecavium]|uniref:L,D-transpeptidase family protein n=1 Tax=Candidatus Blautia faecavium TaxID=2838487 RepID=A0A9D2LUA4_9FIRM|nr:L,D-transpeptidase family protein [Candidatus Blautia faecavium]